MSVGAVGIMYFCYLFSLIKITKNKNECESNPYTASLAIKRSCLMQSKALERSVSSAPSTKPPLSKTSFYFSTITSRQCCA